MFKGLVCYQMFVIWEGCVGVFKLPLLQFSGVIETLNTECTRAVSVALACKFFHFIFLNNLLIHCAKLV